MISILQEGLSLSELLLVPQYSDIKSRKTVDITSYVGYRSYRRLELPVISSPMNTITEDKMCCKMSFEGGLGIIHRYNTIEQQIQIVKKAIEGGSFLLGAAVGITGDFLERTQELLKLGVEVICLDVAHGHHILMKEAIEKIKCLPNIDLCHIIAGNVATGDGFLDLYHWGADSIRVGIGGGSICSTRLNTRCWCS